MHVLYSFKGSGEGGGLQQAECLLPNLDSASGQLLRGLSKADPFQKTAGFWSGHIYGTCYSADTRLTSPLIGRCDIFPVALSMSYLQ